jgi:hypothetical protein
MKTQRLFIALTAVACLTIGSAQAASADDPGDHGHDHGGTTTVTPFPVQFVINESNCSMVPPGTVLTGEGTLTDTKTVRVRDGVTIETVVTPGEGTASDQNGKHYHWKYFSTSKASNSREWTNLFSGVFDDRFSLSGDGPITLENGFTAVTVSDTLANTFGLYPKKSYGDPFAFPTGPNRCDPV